jgi:hypothetical protein
VERLAGVLAVQFSSAYRYRPGRGGAWEILVLLAGMALLGHGIVPMLRMHRWRAQAFSTRGRVIDYVPSPVGRGKLAWLPLIEFEADGETVTFDSPVEGPRRRWPVGRVVDVLYDPADPHRAGLADAGSAISWSLVLGVAIVGLFLFVAAT